MTKKSVRTPSARTARTAAPITHATSPEVLAAPDAPTAEPAKAAAPPVPARRQKSAGATPGTRKTPGREATAPPTEAAATVVPTQKPAARKPAARKPPAKAAGKAAVAEPVVATGPAAADASLTSSAAPGLTPPATGGLRVLVVSPECSPYVNSGDLGDAVGALVDSLAAAGHDVTCVVPRFPGVLPGTAEHDLRTIRMGDRSETVTLYRAARGPHARIIAVDHQGFFDRQFLYGEPDHEYPDNPRRFAALTMVACDLAAEAAVPFDVIHAFDWQAGLLPVLARARAADSPHLARAALVFTAHAPVFQGCCGRDWLRAFGLDNGYGAVGAMEYWGGLSLLKGGVNFADLVTVRSVEDAVTPPGGWGFEGIFAARGADLVELDLDAEPAEIGQRALELYQQARKRAATRVTA